MAAPAATVPVPAPTRKVPAVPAEQVPATTGATHLLQVAKPWFLLPLLGWAMVFATHLILNAFQSLTTLQLPSRTETRWTPRTGSQPLL